MHRQFPDPVTGYTCEIALISQDPGDFSRFVKGVVEQVFFMEKLTNIGSDTRYRVDIYQRKISRKPMRQLQRSYNPRYFPCYKSHSQSELGAAAPIESSADKRGNILHGFIFKVGLPIAAIFLLLGLYGIYRFLNPKTNIEKNTPVLAVVDQSPTTRRIASIERPSESDAWRSVGYYLHDGGLTATVQNSAGVLRVLVNPPAYKISSFGIEVEMPEGGFATPWAIVQKSKVFP
jgi:zona occludens toxin